MDPFASLGIAPTFELDSVLERRYRELQRQLHPDRYANAPASQRRMALQRSMEINEAYRILRDELTRAEAVLAHHGVASKAEPAEPEFLMEIMALRDALGDAKATRDGDRVTELAARVEEERTQTRRVLASAFGALGLPPDQERIGEIQRALNRLRYYRRFLEEVSVIEDGLGL